MWPGAGICLGLESVKRTEHTPFIILNFCTAELSICELGIQPIEQWHTYIVNSIEFNWN